MSLEDRTGSPVPAGAPPPPGGSYTLAEAALALAVREQTLRDWICEGEIIAEPAPLPERGLRVPEDEVARVRRGRTEALIAICHLLPRRWDAERELASERQVSADREQHLAEEIDRLYLIVHDLEERLKDLSA